MTKAPALTEEQVEPFARAICSLEDAVVEREQISRAIHHHETDSNCPTYEELDEKVGDAVMDELSNLIGRVASDAFAYGQDFPRSAKSQTGAVAP